MSHIIATNAGVVLSDDTIVTDASLDPSMTDAEAEFEFSLGFHDPEFISPLLSSRLDSSNVLVVKSLRGVSSPAIFDYTSKRPQCTLHICTQCCRGRVAARIRLQIS